MAGNEFEAKQGELPEYELPPFSPQRPSFHYSVESHPVWNTDATAQRLYEKFSSREYRIGLESLVDFVSPTLEKRWQLGYVPRLIHHPDGEVIVEFPKTSEISLNNRKRHSVEVASVARELGEALGYNEGDLYLLSVAGLLHDYGHIAFSHIGDEFVEHLLKRAADGGKYREALEEANLQVSHEERTILQIQDPESELAAELKRIGIDGEKKDRLLTVLSEEGIGALLNIADTSAYLNLDSIFYGYKAPHFEKHFAKILTRNGDAVTVQNNQMSQEVLTRFGQYRDFLYKNQYFHPFNRAHVQTQSLAFEAHFNGLPNSSTRKKFLRDLTTMSDTDLLAQLRKRTLMETSVLGASFFGIPLNGVRVMEPGEQIKIGQITAEANGQGRSKIMKFVSDDGNEIVIDINKITGDVIANSPFPRDTRLSFFHGKSFLNTFAPLFMRLAEMSSSIHKEPLVMGDFVDAYGRDTLSESPEFVRKLMELAVVDTAVKYRIEDVMDLSTLRTENRNEGFMEPQAI